MSIPNTNTEPLTLSTAGQISVSYTAFAQLNATSKEEHTKPWATVALALARPRSYASKAACPLVSFCTYSGARTPAGALRHKDAVMNVYGVEGDYDAETMTLAQAAEILDAHGLTYVLYTSASSETYDPKTKRFKGERWRVVVPLSKAHGPTERTLLVGRLNAILGGVLTTESFTLSQSFYFGKIQGLETQFKSRVQLQGQALDVVLSNQSDLEPLYPQQVLEALERLENLERLGSDGGSQAKGPERYEDPRDKTDTNGVGAFCRAYEPAHAIATFLTEHFALVRGRRYDWIGHDTVGGVYIHRDSAQHVSGSHDSWPLGKSANSFDLVRQFLFDPQMLEDRTVEPFKRPSHMAMLAFIRTLPDPELQALSPLRSAPQQLPPISGALVEAELARLGFLDAEGEGEGSEGEAQGGADGTAETDTETETETETEGLKLHDFKHMLKGRAATWVAKNLVQTPSIGAIYGAPGAGKSFLVLDLCLAIARGLSTFGLQDKPTRITQGGVIYIAAEGGAGIHQRLQAYAQAHDLSEGDIAAFSPYFKVLTAAPNMALIEGSTGVAAVIHAARSQMTKPVKLVVFDTLSSVSGAIDENSFEVMRLIDSAKAVAHALQCASYYIHHSGKDATRGLRGFSGLNGALDTIINVTRDKDTGLACAHVEKQKDGFDGANYFFELDCVLLGVDADDDTYGSLVVRHLQGTDDQGVGRVRPTVSRTGLKKGGGGGEGDEAGGGGVRLRPLQQELYDLLCAEPEPISPKDLLVKHKEWMATAKPDVRWHRINTTKSIQSLVDKAALLDIEVDKLGGRPDIYGARRETLFVTKMDDL